MPTPIIEALGFAIMAIWLCIGIAEYTKGKRAMLTRRQLMGRLYLMVRYLYASLMLLGVVVLIWQWALPAAHTTAGH